MDILPRNPGETINFSPATELEEIAQNVQTIISTPRYSVPLNRGFGVTADFIDQPNSPSTWQGLQAEIFNQIRKYEPRADVQAVRFEPDGFNRLRPKVTIKLREGARYEYL